MSFMDGHSRAGKRGKLGRITNSKRGNVVGSDFLHESKTRIWENLGRNLAGLGTGAATSALYEPERDKQKERNGGIERNWMQNG